jgi:hypothetical protein
VEGFYQMQKEEGGTMVIIRLLVGFYSLAFGNIQRRRQFALKKKYLSVPERPFKIAVTICVLQNPAHTLSVLNKVTVGMIKVQRTRTDKISEKCGGGGRVANCCLNNDQAICMMPCMLCLSLFFI